MIVALDTNILLDILVPDPVYKTSSLNLLSRHMKINSLIISEIVYCELASQFIDENLLKNFLSDVNINLVNSSPNALWFAARVWEKYTGERGKFLQCNKCGKKEIYKCTDCNSTITSRQHINSDFLIGAHAFLQANRLVTRDRGFYRTYFPELKIEF